MSRASRMTLALVWAIWAAQGGMAHAQWSFPGGFGGFRWGGWGSGSAEADVARGIGLFAEDTGFYERMTAEARSIDAATVMRWNQFMHESQMNANRVREQRQASTGESKTRLNDERQRRLRDKPEPRDIECGDALNAALDEIDDPRVYARALQTAGVRIGGQAIRQIPFRFGSAAITFSIHELAERQLPTALQMPGFVADREAFELADVKLTEQVAEGKDPDPATVDRLLAAIYSAETRVGNVYPRNTLARDDADRFLKGLHGLAAMLKTPALDVILAGVENRPDATLGELLNFMVAFNLRFGVATTAQQKQIYTTLYPKLVQVRNEIAPALAASGLPLINGMEPEDFFSVMTMNDLQKRAPQPLPATGPLR